MTYKQPHLRTKRVPLLPIVTCLGVLKFFRDAPGALAFSSIIALGVHNFFFLNLALHATSSDPSAAKQSGSMKTLVNTSSLQHYNKFTNRRTS